MRTDTPDPLGPRYQRLTLDLLIDGDPPSGVLHAGGDTLPFTGWLGLVSVLLRASEACGETA